VRRAWSLFIPLLLPLHALPAQAFFTILQRADSTDQAGAHAAAVKLYEQAYTLSGFDPAGLGVAARSAALAGLRDVAFRDLDRAIDQGYIVPKFLTDSAFLPLHDDPRWKEIDTKLRAKIAALDQPLRNQIIALAEQDRRNRQDFRTVMSKVKPNTPEGVSAFKAFNSADSAVQAAMQGIIAAHGWPVRSKVADDGAHAAWIVVQNMSLDYQATVLPRLLAAVKAGEAQPGDGALLQDRVLARSKKPQIYGSHLSVSPTSKAPVIDPIENEECVDVRRKSVGLEPMADYVKRFGIVYQHVGVCAAGKL
jgi:hypothetical protein